MQQLKCEMRTSKMELEARVQAAEDARRQITDQLDEITTKQQRDIAKQVALRHHHYLFAHKNV